MLLPFCTGSMDSWHDPEITYIPTGQPSPHGVSEVNTLAKDVTEKLGK